MNVVDAIFAHVRERPNHPAVEDGARVFSYSRLAALVDCAATRLHGRGIAADDIVVIRLPDTVEHVAALLALAGMGAISFSVDERTPEVENRAAIRGLEIKAAIVRRGTPRFLEISTFPVDALFAGLDEAKAVASVPRARAAFDADSPLMLIQSSGTTGEPKRLFFTHRQMAERNQRSLALLGLTATDRYFQVPSLRFFDGRRRCFKMLMLGATVVINHAATIAEYARYFTDHGITYVYFTPYHLRALLATVQSDESLWPRLKIVIGSAPSTPEERLLARQRLTPLLFDCYGTNEVGNLVLAGPADQDLHPDSIGRLIDGIEAQIADGNGLPLPAGQVGLIGFRGPHFPNEYPGDPEATARHFRDGWFYPGDLAMITEDGYVFFKGRADDVINNSGAKYFPAEIEAVLLSHPAVADAAVIGGPHPQFGEVSVAYVVRSSPLSPNELYKFCEGKIAMFKAPSWVFFLDELPRVATGKADKKRLRELFRRHLETLRK